MLHKTQLVARVDALYLPLGHKMQALTFDVPEKVPLTHGWHVKFPLRQEKKKPSWQIHPCCAALGVELELSGQGVHFVAPVALYVLAGQLSHADAFPAAYVPSSHALQAVTVVCPVPVE